MTIQGTAMASLVLVGVLLPVLSGVRIEVAGVRVVADLAAELIEQRGDQERVASGQPVTRPGELRISGPESRDGQAPDGVLAQRLRADGDGRGLGGGAQQAGREPVEPRVERLKRAKREGLLLAVDIGNSTTVIGVFRDEETGYHLVRMARYSRLIADTIGLERDEAESIELAAPLHDIGKIGIPDQILLKANALEDAEWQIMRRHPLIGHEILKGSASKYVRMGALIALGHHEKYDGSGYPNGLVGDHVPLCARIVAVADVYDALTSVRPYKAAWSSEQAFEYVRTQAGRHFDPRMVDAFLAAKKEVLQIQHEWRNGRS